MDDPNFDPFKTKGLQTVLKSIEIGMNPQMNSTNWSGTKSDEVKFTVARVKKVKKKSDHLKCCQTEIRAKFWLIGPDDLFPPSFLYKHWLSA